jgi:glycosyltransferase involved in cell wall biosynthesis
MNTSPAFGIRVAPDDVEGLVRAIECLSANPDQSAAFGTTGRQLFERHFDQPIALAKWTSLITELGA